MCLACWHAICVSSVAGTKSFNFISFAGDTGISSVCRGSRRMAHLGLSQRAPHAKYVHVPVMLCQTQGAESKTHDNRMRFTMKRMKRWGGGVDSGLNCAPTEYFDKSKSLLLHLVAI